MAFTRLVYALAVLFPFTLCGAEPEKCTQCKLSPVGEGFASEFHLKASEKGVRLVYLNLKIGNESYHPLELQDEFLPATWVWANTISEPMLSLSYDYDILSLSLLNYQVRSMDVQLKDQPSGCLASLNSFCQNMTVGRMLLENVTTEDTEKLSHKTQVVCVAMIQTDLFLISTKRIKYHCCDMQKVGSYKTSNNGSLIRCDLTVDDNSWLEALTTIVVVLSLFLGFYIPALPLALPDCVFSLKYECDKEDRAKQADSTQADSRHTRNGYIQINHGNEEEEDELIPVDDASPMNLSTFLLVFAQSLPDVRFSFNIKLAILWFCLYPCVVYAQLAFYFLLKKTFINESLRKHLDLDHGEFALFFSSRIIYIFPATATFTGLVPVLFSRPKDFFYSTSSHCSKTVGDQMRHNLQKMQNSFYQWLQYFVNAVQLVVACGSNSTMCSDEVSRIRRALCVLWRLFFILLKLPVVCLLSVLVFLICFPVLSAFLLLYFSPLRSLVLTCKYKIIVFMAQKKFSCPLKVFAWMVLLSYITAFYLVNYYIICVSCTFIGGVLGFTILGLVLNAEIVTPYAAFVLVVITNIYLCYSNLQNRFKEVKRIILKWKNEIHKNSSDPEGTIPSKLFWCVCDRVLPIRTEFCLMFRNVVLILAFFYLVVYSIVFFRKGYNVSAVFSTIAVFVSGVIPSLVSKGLTKKNIFIGWEKIKIKREIETAVREFYQGNSGESRVERSQSHRINNDDTLV